ncbi:hypothetical protein RUM43_008800 [Polyplax serrata]|uniref:Uncharacterized protein n=1 Tax=Polyplax serrata TaxID=468196 RepID=A0AAN8P9T8_POLSC
MPYTFNLPSFLPISNLDEYGRSLFRKGFGGFPGFDGRKASRHANNLIDQLFPNDFGGGRNRPPRDFGGRSGPSTDYGGPSTDYGGIPSRLPKRDPREPGGTGSIGGGSYHGSTGDAANSGKGSISSLPKFKETAGQAASLIYRCVYKPLDLPWKNRKVSPLRDLAKKPLNLSFNE